MLFPGHECLKSKHFLKERFNRSTWTMISCTYLNFFLCRKLRSIELVEALHDEIPSAGFLSRHLQILIKPLVWESTFFRVHCMRLSETNNSLTLFLTCLHVTYPFHSRKTNVVNFPRKITVRVFLFNVLFQRKWQNWRKQTMSDCFYLFFFSDVLMLY